MEEKKVEKTAAKTALGIDENIEAALCYVLGFISGVFFLLAEKENKFVKFHAVQSILTTAAFIIIYAAALLFPFVGWIVLILLGLVLMYKAYKGEYFKLPFVGDISEKQIK